MVSRTTSLRKAFKPGAQDSSLDSITDTISPLSPTAPTLNNKYNSEIKKEVS